MIDSIDDRLRRLLQETQAVNRNKYVNFANIWKNPKTLLDCASIINDYLADINSKNDYFQNSPNNNLVLLSPDNLGGNFGIIPITFTIASSLGCKIAIWKEFANIEWGTSAILGCKEKKLNCILIQDVVDEGTTAIKIASHLKELEWNFILYLSAIMNSSNKAVNIDNTLTQVGEILGKKPDFRYILQM